MSLCSSYSSQLKLLNRAKITYGSELVLWGYVLTHCLIVLVSFPLSIPGIFLNLPIAYLSRKRALSQQKVALAASKVKVGAYDVVASEMVKWAGIFLPAFYLLYIVVAAVASSIFINESHPNDVKMLEWAIPVALTFFLPVFSYWSIRLADVWYFSFVKALAVAFRNSAETPRLLARRKEVRACDTRRTSFITVSRTSL